jgi:hypothetical protein
MSLQQGHYLVFNLWGEIEETPKNVVIARYGSEKHVMMGLCIYRDYVNSQWIMELSSSRLGVEFDYFGCFDLSS